MSNNRSVTVTLPDEDKVSGAFTMHWTDNDHAAVYTDGAHINDHNQAIDFRDESWLVWVNIFRLSDGTLTNVNPHGSDYRSVTRRQNWSDAPPSYARAIVAAVTDAAIAAWDDGLAANAQRWTDENDAAQLRAEVAELAAQLKGKRAELRKIERRL